MKFSRLLTDDADKSAHDPVRDYWQSQRPEKGQAFEAFGKRRCMTA